MSADYLNSGRTAGENYLTREKISAVIESTGEPNPHRPSEEPRSHKGFAVNCDLMAVCSKVISLISRAISETILGCADNYGASAIVPSKKTSYTSTIFSCL